ncbi:MAG: hypothetical protein ACI92G_002950 [Candidatus Pelagisphaera sp.]|jgi:hypothetical protein
MAKLAHTSESVINIGLIVLNLDKALRELLSWLYLQLPPKLEPSARCSDGAHREKLEVWILKLIRGIRLNPAKNHFFGRLNRNQTFSGSPIIVTTNLNENNDSTADF